MSEAKSQYGSTVKGYRTLRSEEIEDMNELKNPVVSSVSYWINRKLGSRRASMTDNHSA